MGLQISESFKAFVGQKLPQVSARSVAAVLELHAEGATVPFIARYRKEKTGNLDEVAIRDVLKSYEGWQELTARREFVLKEIEKQGGLTQDLRKQILGTDDIELIEEIYRPFKKKKKTKAKIAKDAGLEPFAEWIWGLGHGTVTEDKSLEVKAKEFLNPGAGFATYEEVLRGAGHILVERLSANLELRQKVKTEYFERGKVKSQKGPDYKSHSKFETYADFSEDAKSLMTPKASHRYLALRRGWQEGELKVSIEADDEGLLRYFAQEACPVAHPAAQPFLLDCAKQALQVHVVPSVTNELHRFLKEAADRHGIQVFAENVRRVLMGSPFGPRIVIGVDPGLRTGCKIALIDKGGNFISHTVLKVTGEGAQEEAKRLFGEVLKQIKIDGIAVGNGTGGREAEAFIRQVVKDLGYDVPVVMVSEAGASVYSASDIAREEFPELDLTVRGAISIGRRLQDPLAELVKIDPKSIGVGQYQHDVNQTQLKKSLEEVVESCVNQVGVDLNTASFSLLQYVSGIGPVLAKNVVQYRKENGLFKERSELMKIPQFSGRTFEQAAGFLRIFGGSSPLDQTGIHPERYSAVKDMLHEVGLQVSQALGLGPQNLKERVGAMREKWVELLGEYTFDDILTDLSKPGRDPRDPYKVFEYRQDIHTVGDLKEGMICPGIVTNVTNFGAFVDVGVHQDGLVHISEMAYRFVDDPRVVVSPGDQVQVRVLKVDKDKNQISFSMRLEERKPEPAPRSASSDGAPRPRPKRPERNEKSGRSRGDVKPDRASGPARPHGQTRTSGQARTSGPARPPGPPKRREVPFNNPFAALGQLKK